MVETSSDSILEGASTSDVTLLVVGDPFGATTHTDILLRARSLKIPYQIIHNASIMNAMGACGLQLYNFGQTVSIPFWTESWKPDSWLERIEENARLGMHTLLLLDIKVKEQSEENLARYACRFCRRRDFNYFYFRGRKIYEPPRYMSPTVALSQLLSAISSHPNSHLSRDKTLAMTLSRVGSPSQEIKAGTLQEFESVGEEEFGEPLHTMVIVGSRLHPLEVEYAMPYAVGTGWRDVARDVYGIKLEGEPQ
jgi:diphthine synthase